MESAKQANKLFLGLMIFYFCSTFVVRSISKIWPIPLNITLVLSEVLIVLPVIFYLVWTKKNPWKWLLFKPLHPAVILLLIVFTYLMMPLMTLLNLISMLFSENATIGMMDMISVNPLWINVILIGAVPAFVEEFVCRGVFYQSYRCKSHWTGIWMSGILFGLIHLNFNQFTYAFVMGIIFAFLIEATGSIFAPMLVHFIFNTNSVIINYQVPVDNRGIDTVWEMRQLFAETPGIFIAAITFFGIIAIIGTAIGTGAFIGIARLSHRWEYVKGLFIRKPKGITDNRSESIIDYYLIDGIAICLVYMVCRLVVVWIQ